MHICKCGQTIPQERFELGYTICIICGERLAKNRRPVGYMCYSHKTAGEIVVTTQAGLDNYKKVSYRMNKGSNMGYASRLNTQF